MDIVTEQEEPGIYDSVPGENDSAPPPIPESEKLLVGDLLEKAKSAADYWEPRFKHMRDNQRFVRGFQWPGDENPFSVNANYVANITKREINQRIASIYAKNPTFVARLRNRLWYEIWSGDEGELQMALVSATKGTATPEQIALLEDYQAAELTKAKMKRVGKTLEVLFKHQLDEPIPNFKRRFKQMVRRAKINGVAYIKLGFQRLLETKPETSSRIHDASQKIAELEALAKQVSQKNSDETHTKEMEQLKHQMTLLQQEPKQIIKEGLVFSYPKSTAVFPDEECENIDGFVGASYIFEEHLMTPKDILKFFDLDVGENSGREYRKFSKDLAQKDDQGAKRKRKTGNDYGRVYEIYDLDNQVLYWVLEGYDGFLKPPGLPDVWLEQFHPYYPLVINPLDDESDPYSESDVDDMRPMQMEYNRARQGLREHRQVNRPGYMGPKAFFSEREGQTLASHAVGQYIGLEAL